MNTFNKEQLLDDLKNWNQLIRKYQIPNTKEAIIQLANSFVFYILLLALQFYLYDKSFFFSAIVALFNGFILSIILLLGSHFLLGVEYIIGITVSISLITVIVIASLIGTFVPITLNKYGIDPALATGPFITTSNDIFGILIYFSIAKMILGF